LQTVVHILQFADACLCASPVQLDEAEAAFVEAVGLVELLCESVTSGTGAKNVLKGRQKGMRELMLHSRHVKATARHYFNLEARSLQSDGSKHICLSHIESLAADLPEGAKILDAGCGAGTAIEALLSLKEKKFSVVGVDIADDFLTKAEDLLSTFENRYTLMRSDILHCDFPDASFDAVVCLDLLSYIPAQEALLLVMKLTGWLRPGGILISSARMMTDDSVKAEEICVNEKLACVYRHLFKVGEFSGMLKMCSLHVAAPTFLEGANANQPVMLLSAAKSKGLAWA
jgi:ubiquinone/menaquinone biosynthesis C-methylase UbiE